MTKPQSRLLRITINVVVLGALGAYVYYVLLPLRQQWWELRQERDERRRP